MRRTWILPKPGASRFFPFPELGDGNPRSMTRFDAHIDQEWELLGLANIVMARIKSDGSTDYAHLIVDCFCLGVKDVIVTTGVSESDYHEYLRVAMPTGVPETMHPACARKLIEGAVAYAESLGFAPHRDYRKARRVFSGVDASICPREFTYGCEGRPRFIRGPHDSEERVQRVLTMLDAKLGADGFVYEDPDGDDGEEGLRARDELMDWLEAEPEHVPRFYEFSGMVAGLLLSPDHVPPLTILKLLYGGPAGRVWRDQAEVEEFNALYMAYWNEINTLILDSISSTAEPADTCIDVWEEEFAPDEGPIFLLALRDWCAGLVRATELWPAADRDRLTRPALGRHWELIVLFSQIEAPGNSDRLDQMGCETPPRNLGTCVAFLTRALRQPLS
jgi:hypothetical protein